MADGNTMRYTILKYGILFAAFCTLFITELLILFSEFPPENNLMESVNRSDPKMETEQYITEVRFPSFFRTHQEQQRYINTSNSYHLPSRCCKRDRRWISPDTMKDLTGVIRIMAQFEGKKQFFKHERCILTTEYCLCVCAIERAIISAIYVHPGNSYHIGVFVSDECCKCV